MSVYFWILLVDIFRLLSAYLQGKFILSKVMHPDSLKNWSARDLG